MAIVGVAGATGYSDEKGEQDMTKARARQRAKAKAAQPAKKREPAAGQAGQKNRPGQYGSKEQSISSPRANANANSVGATGRGAARSR